jgi:hypothetical protein
MRVLRSVLVLFGLTAGCNDSCACGEGGQDAPTTQAGPVAGRVAAPPVAVGNAGGAATAEAPSAQPSWQPAPDSELTRQLAAAKTALETEQVYEQLTVEKALGKPLGDKLGNLKADGELSTTVREGSQAKVAVAARNYTVGDKSVRVKITDTGLLPNARRVVSNRLTLVGNDAVGNERGVFVRGYPAVVAHYADQQLSRASALLGNRYLVQVMVRNATDPEDALRVIEQLDWTGVAPRQGKIPAAD